MVFSIYLFTLVFCFYLFYISMNVTRLIIENLWNRLLLKQQAHK